MVQLRARKRLRYEEEDSDSDALQYQKSIVKKSRRSEASRKRVRAQRRKSIQFFDLPLEVREMVYHHLFLSTRIVLSIKFLPHIVFNGVKAFQVSQDHVCNNHTDALLRTSRKCYSEAMKHYKLNVSHVLTLSDPLEILTGPMDFCLPKVRQVELPDGPLPFFMTSRKWFQILPDLKELTIKIEDPPDGFLYIHHVESCEALEATRLTVLSDTEIKKYIEDYLASPASCLQLNLPKEVAFYARGRKSQTFDYPIVGESQGLVIRETWYRDFWSNVRTMEIELGPQMNRWMSTRSGSRSPRHYFDDRR